MTVAEWIAGRSPQAPPALTRRMVAVLAGDSGAPEAGTAELCLAAAVRSLEDMLADGRFDRSSALDLLAVDALTTLAFEHASGSIGDVEQLSALARRTAAAFGQSIAQRA